MSDRRLITNSSDRTLRQFNLPLTFPSQLEEEEQELEPAYKFSDPISRVAWHNMTYSPDGEWLAGGKENNSEPATLPPFTTQDRFCRSGNSQDLHLGPRVRWPVRDNA